MREIKFPKKMLELDIIGLKNMIQLNSFDDKEAAAYGSKAANLIKEQLKRRPN